MATFDVVVADPEQGETHQFEIDGQDANRFLGRDIGDEVDGDAVGLTGYSLEITGGSDVTGRPMRPDVRGTDVKEILLKGGPGFNPTRDGERRRVSVRGREVSEETAQLNVKISEYGDEDVDALLGEGGEDAEGDDE